MRVLAIDPGYERLGIAIVDKEKGQKEIYVYSECFKTSKDTPFEDRLLLIGQKIQNLIIEYKPVSLSIELLYIEKNQKTAMKVSETRGVILYEAIKHGLNISEFTPLQIKLAVSGSGNASKKDLAKILPYLIKLPAKKMIDDELDAISIALTFYAYKK